MQGADFIAGVILIGIAALFIYGIYKLVQYSNKKLLESYQRIQQKYPSLQLSKDENRQYSNVKSNILKGTIKELPFVCYNYQTGSGKHAVHWTTFEFQHGISIQDYTLRLLSEHIFYKMGKSLNFVKEIEIGVELFDKRFLIQSQNEMKTRALLTMPIRERMLQIPSFSFGEFNLDGISLKFKVPAIISNEKNCNYFLETIEIGLDLIAELKRISR